MYSNLLFIQGLGGWEIILVLAVILIFFGAKRIPELARGMGRGIREFKDATREIKDEVNNAANSEPTSAGNSTTSTTTKTND